MQSCAATALLLQLKLSIDFVITFSWHVCMFMFTYLFAGHLRR